MLYQTVYIFVLTTATLPDYAIHNHSISTLYVHDYIAPEFLHTEAIRFRIPKPCIDFNSPRNSTPPLVLTDNGIFIVYSSSAYSVYGDYE